MWSQIDPAHGLLYSDRPLFGHGYVLYRASPPMRSFRSVAFAYVPLNSTSLGQHAFISLYCLANFFQNFGPNTTTFIIPGEVFPTRYRSTAYGISAACGKIGAIVAQLAIGQSLLNNDKSMQIM